MCVDACVRGCVCVNVREREGRKSGERATEISLERETVHKFAVVRFEL